MTLLILEMLLALAVIVGIMVWTLKTRTDTPIDVLEKKDELPVDTADRHAPGNKDSDDRPKA